MEVVCKGLEKEKCLPPKCTYANGPKLKYCKKNTKTAIKTATPQPKAATPQPKASKAQPKASKAQPKASKAQPKASNAQPKAATPQPKASKAQPKTNTPSGKDCKGLSKELCLPPKCSYVNGKKLKYCKKNTKKIKLVTPKKRSPTPKKKSSTPLSLPSLFPLPMSFSPPGFEETKEHSPQRIPSSPSEEYKKNHIIPKTTTSSILARKSTSSNKKKIKDEKNKTRKGNIIKKFMVKNKTKLTALFLNSICQDSGVCMAFGKETDKIKSFFNNYITFDYAINQKEIASGANGTVVEIEYERLKYKSFAILKKSQQVRSDNLFYEYLVGQFINSKYKKLPCLLQTYGVFFTPSGLIDNLNTLEYLDTSTMPNMLAGLRQSCLTPTKTLLLIEHIKGSQTLKEQIKSEEFIDCDLIHSLFQIFFTLNVLKDVFTHYDLHCNNILTYIPIQNKYIQYHFHLQNETVTFKSPYLIKIIDYGRCHFDDQAGMNSEKIYKLTTTAGVNCGMLQGYNWFDETKKLRKPEYYINSLILNRSHDLRVLKVISDNINMLFLDYFVFNNTVYSDVKTLFTKVVYSDNYGTTQKLKSGLPQKVHNVMDAFNLLKKICMNPAFKQDNDNTYSAGSRSGFTKLGNLHIYADGRDMVFTHINNIII